MQANIAKFSNSSKSQLAQLRNNFTSALSGSGGFDVQRMQVLGTTERLTNAIKKQDLTLGQAIKNRKSFNDVLAKQMALQKAMAVQWSRNGAGVVDADLIVPRGLDGRLASATQKLGLLGTVAKSVSTNLVNWGKNTQWAGRQLMVGFTVPVIAAGAAFGMLAYRMDTELVRIQKVYGSTSQVSAATSKQVREDSLLTAKDVAQNYGIAATETLKMIGDLAAAGYEGQQLQQMASETARIATLGEIDHQQAIKGTIAIQTVFGKSTDDAATKTKFLGDTMNYLNAVENSTSLSLQDLFEAIPRAAGPIKQAGGDIKDLSVLLVAAKERGIDAAEAANSIKSAFQRLINPAKTVSKQFKELTGQDLEQLVNQGNGKLIPTLELIGESVQNLDNLNRSRVLAKLFGTYQYGKLSAMLDGIVNKTGQVGAAMELASASADTLAQAANREIQTSQQSLSGRFKRQLETLKTELAEAGKPFLGFANMFLSIVAKIVGAFNGLPKSVKSMAAVGIIFVGLIGPVVMLLGLFVNLIGQFFKLGASILQLGTRFKLVNAEERLLELTSKAASGGILAEADATRVLNAEMIKLVASMKALDAANARQAAADAARAKRTAQYQRQVAAQRFAQQGGTQVTAYSSTAPRGQRPVAPINPYGSTIVQNVGGRQKRVNQEARRAQNAQNFAAKNPGNAGPGSFIPLNGTRSVMNASTMPVKETAKIAENTDKAAKNVGRMVSGFSGLATGLMLVTAMTGTTNKLVLSLTTGLFILSLMPGMLSRIGNGIAGAFSKVGKMSAVQRAVTTVSTGLKAWGPMIMRSLGVAGIAAAGVFAAYKILHSNIEKTREEQDKINKSTDTWSKILGYTKVQYSQLADVQTKALNDQNNAAKQLQQAQPGLIREIQGLQGDLLQQRLIQEGLRVKLSGGSAEQVNKAIQTLLTAAGHKTYEIPDIIAKINAKVNWANQDAIIAQSVKSFGDSFQREANNQFSQGKSEGIVRLIAGDRDKPNTRATEDAKQVAKDWYATFSTINAQQREAFFNKSTQEMAARQKKMFDDLAKTNADYFNGQGIKNYQDLVSKAFSGNDLSVTGPGQMIGNQIGGDNLRNLRIAAISEKNLAQGIAEAAGASKKDIENTKNLAEAKKALQIPIYGVTEAYNKWLDAMSRAGLQGVQLSEVQKAQILNTYRLGAGLTAAATSGEGFNDVMGKTSSGLLMTTDALAKATAQYQKHADAIKNAMSAAQGGVLDYASTALSDQQSAQADALAKRNQAREDALAKRQQAAQDALDARQQASKDKFDKQRKDVTAAYDARIQKIKDEQDAEDKADQNRERIAQNEINRIKRIADAANSTIDFNAAMRGGNFDEAARVMNSAMASQASNMADDANNTATAAAAAKKDASDKRVDNLDKQKTAALDNIDKTEKAADAALDAQKKRLKETQDAQAASLAAQDRAAEDSNKRQQAATQKRLELELSMIKASVPRTKEEYDRQITQIEQLYNKYGVNLKAKGTEWSNVIATSLSTSIEAARISLGNDEKWTQFGADVADKVLQGGLNMSQRDFFSWLATGKLPSTANLNPDAVPTGGTKGMTLHHEGGMAGEKSSRGGRSKTHGLFRDEIPNVTLQKGEFVMKKKAVDKYGKDTMEKINNGAMDDEAGIGGPSGALGITGIMGAMVGAAARSAIQKQVTDSYLAQYAADGASAADAGVPGMAAGELGIDAVLRGIKMQESGGNYKARSNISSASGAYQYINGTWNNYKGYASAYMAPPAVQDARAREDVQNAYEKYKDWEEVIASHFYPAWAGDKTKWNQSPSPGNPTVRDYVNGVLSKAGYTNGANRASASAPGAAQTSSPNEWSLPVSPLRFIRGFTGANAAAGDHTGIDLDGETGDPVRAVGPGRVILSDDIHGKSKYNNLGYASYGRYIIVDHGDIQTLYAHLSQRIAQTGDVVNGKDLIGLMGTTGNSTGSHLHFEARRGGHAINPMGLGIPGLMTGGNIKYDNTIANLHKDETVLTAPLSAALERGIKNLDSGSNTQYNINITAAPGQDANEIANLVVRKIEQKKTNLGRSRTVK